VGEELLQSDRTSLISFFLFFLLSAPGPPRLSPPSPCIRVPGTDSFWFLSPPPFFGTQFSVLNVRFRFATLISPPSLYPVKARSVFIPPPNEPLQLPIFEKCVTYHLFSLQFSQVTDSFLFSAFSAFEFVFAPQEPIDCPEQQNFTLYGFF